MAGSPPARSVKCLLVDGLNLIRRIHAGVPGDPESDEHFAAAVDTTERSLRRALDELEPTHALSVFDAGGQTWRHELHPDYKQGRAPMPARLRRGLAELESRIGGLGIRTVSVPGVEADDVLATIALKLAGRGGAVLVLSTDKSLLPLLGHRIQVRNHFSGENLDEAYVERRFGVRPGQIPSYLALVGDASLNVPGVRGVGARTAASLLADHEDLEAILRAAPELPARPGRALLAGADDARLSLRLVRLKTDVPVGLNLKDLRLP